MGVAQVKGNMGNEKGQFAKGNVPCSKGLTKGIEPSVVVQGEKLDRTEWCCQKKDIPSFPLDNTNSIKFT